MTDLYYCCFFIFVLYYNNAALLLSEKIGLSNIQTLMDKYSFTDSSLGTVNGSPVTTPIDIAIFLKDLYTGKLINPEYSKNMLELLRRQKLNSKLPKYLPGEVTVAHKTGELDEFNHDAGIVFTLKGDYIIVVMTESDIYSRAQVEDRIALISEGVYKYFTQDED